MKVEEKEMQFNLFEMMGMNNQKEEETKVKVETTTEVVEEVNSETTSTTEVKEEEKNASQPKEEVKKAIENKKEQLKSKAKKDPAKELIEKAQKYERITVKVFGNVYCELLGDEIKELDLKALTKRLIDEFECYELQSKGLSWNLFKTKESGAALLCPVYEKMHAKG